MPLLDHFHPPLYPARRWESFHAQWAATIAERLNGSLPADYFAEIQSHVGSRVEVDVGTFHADDRSTAAGVGIAAGGTATATLTAPASPYAPPAPAMVMPAIFPDSIEALVYSTVAGSTLVAAVELVSPGNKDRPEFRRGFAAKCAAYLQQGVGVVVVDIVTSRGGNLHNELVSLLDVGDDFRIAPEPLYAVAYRPSRRRDADRIELWPAVLAVGQPLPVLPLPLDKGQFAPLDLETSYNETRQRSRLP